MKYVTIAGCSLGFVMSMVAGSLMIPREAQAELRVEDRGERLKNRF